MKTKAQHFIILISLLLLFTFFNKSMAQNTVHFLDLYHYVPDKSLNQTNKDKQARQKIKVDYYTNNISGITAYWLDNDSLCMMKDTFMFNDKDKKMAIKRTEKSDDTDFQNSFQEVKYTYNLNQIAKIDYLKELEKTSINYKYNPNGKLNEILITYFSKDTPKSTFVKNESVKFTYRFPTENAIEIKKFPEKYSKGGKVFYESEKIQYLFNEKGNLAHICINYTEAGIDTLFFLYNEQHNLTQIKKIKYNAKHPEFTTYFYDASGNLGKIKTPWDSTVFKYGSNGLLSDIITKKDNYKFKYLNDKLSVVIKNRFEENSLIFHQSPVYSKEIQYFHTKDFFVIYNFLEPCVVEFYDKYGMIFLAKVDNPQKSLFISHFPFQKTEMIKIRYQTKIKYMMFTPSILMNGLFGPEPIIFEKKIL